MANTDAAFGFRPWGEILRARLYAVITAPVIHIYHGDIVASENTGVACTGGHGTMLVISDSKIVPATPGDELPLLGAVLAIFDENMVPLKYISATRVGDGTIAGYVLVADHPNQTYVAQEDADTAAVAVADIDLNFDIFSPTLSLGNTYTGVSLQEIDSNSGNVTATIALKITGMAYPNQDSQGSAGCRWIVQINSAAHYYGGSAAI